MARFSADPVLDAFVEKLYARLVSALMTPLPESFREISYGVSFKVIVSGEKEIPVAVYHSEKKGFSIVTDNEEIRRLARSILAPEPTVGCDEAGKGDLFGPLCAACFYLCDASEGVLALNIRDSKRIKDEEILSLSAAIIHRYREYFETVLILPERYNELYAAFRAQGKTLNHLLAWTHAKAIARLAARHPAIGKIIVDQFSESREIIDTIRAAAPHTTVEFRPRAENHPAVATASVLARGTYLRALQKLSMEVLHDTVSLKSGSGADADRIVTTVRERFGEAILSKIAKTHFANLSGDTRHADP